jgi:hypothetical protein
MSNRSQYANNLELAETNSQSSTIKHSSVASAAQCNCCCKVSQSGSRFSKQDAGVRARIPVIVLIMTTPPCTVRLCCHDESYHILQTPVCRHTQNLHQRLCQQRRASRSALPGGGAHRAVPAQVLQLLNGKMIETRTEVTPPR